MNEIAKAGVNHPKNQEKNECKNEEDRVQALMRTQKVYSKKPHIKKKHKRH